MSDQHPNAEGHRAVVARFDISHHAARRLVDDVIAGATAAEAAVTVAVVDNSGVLVAFERMDGAPRFSAQIAIAKAHTAATFGNATSSMEAHVPRPPRVRQQLRPARRLVLRSRRVPDRRRRRPRGRDRRQRRARRAGGGAGQSGGPLPGPVTMTVPRRRSRSACHVGNRDVRTCSREELPRPGHLVPQGHGARRVLPVVSSGRRARPPTPQQRRNTDLLQGKTLLTAFYQPSTRTRLATEAAMHRLGGHVLGFSDAKMTRAGDFYQESIKDTVHMLEYYGDVIAMRHYQQGAPAGSGQVGVGPGHQLRRRVGRAPDPGPDRPLHDLEGQADAGRAQGAVRRRHADADDALDPLRHVPVRHGGATSCRRRRCRCSTSSSRSSTSATCVYREVASVEKCIADADVIYMEPVVQADYTKAREEAGRRARPDAGRLPGDARAAPGQGQERLPSSCTRSRGWTSCPPDVDSTRHARYWFEAFNGVVMRMALLAAVLGAAE